MFTFLRNAALKALAPLRGGKDRPGTSAGEDFYFCLSSRGETPIFWWQTT